MSPEALLRSAVMRAKTTPRSKIIPINEIQQCEVIPIRKAVETPIELPIVPAEPGLTCPTIRSIIEATAAEFKVQVMHILAQRRDRHTSMARHVAVYLASELTIHSFPIIGRHMGGRDHSTMMNSAKKIRRLIENDPDLWAAIGRIKAELIPTRGTE